MCIEQYIVVLIFVQILFNDLASLSVYNLHFRFQRSTFCLFCVVIRVFSSPPQRPMTSVFKRLLYQILHITCCPILNFIYFTTITKQFIQACSLEPMFEFGRSSCGRKPEYLRQPDSHKLQYRSAIPTHSCLQGCCLIKCHSFVSLKTLGNVAFTGAVHSVDYTCTLSNNTLVYSQQGLYNTYSYL